MEVVYAADGMYIGAAVVNGIFAVEVGTGVDVVST